MKEVIQMRTIYNILNWILSIVFMPLIFINILTVYSKKERKKIYWMFMQAYVGSDDDLAFWCLNMLVIYVFLYRIYMYIDGILRILLLKNPTIYSFVCEICN